MPHRSQRAGTLQTRSGMRHLCGNPGIAGRPGYRGESATRSVHDLGTKSRRAFGHRWRRGHGRRTNANSRAYGFAGWSAHQTFRASIERGGACKKETLDSTTRFHGKRISPASLGTRCEAFGSRSMAVPRLRSKKQSCTNRLSHASQMVWADAKLSGKLFDTGSLAQAAGVLGLALKTLIRETLSISRS